MKLTRIGFHPETPFHPDGSKGLFSSAAIIIDEDRAPSKTRGKAVGTVIFSPGGNIVYNHYPKEYTDLDLQVAAEYYVGETLCARRYRTYEINIERSNKL